MVINLEELTKETQKLICLVYKEYLERRKNGFSRDNSAFFRFNFAKDIPQLLKYNPDDIESCLTELSKKGYVKKYVDGGFKLESKGIVMMENRFKNGIKEIVSFIKQIVL